MESGVRRLDGRHDKEAIICREMIQSFGWATTALDRDYLEWISREPVGGRCKNEDICCLLRSHNPV